MAMNRGEWSEFYTILSLLSEPNMTIADETLNMITDNLYTVNKLSVEEQDSIIDYVLDNNLDVEVYFNNELNENINALEISNGKNILFDNIKSAVAGDGAFEIESIQPLLNRMTPNGLIKSRSSSKEDLNAVVLDNRLGKDVTLKYSIKSCLGSPATLLNASSLTNFLYEVKGLTAKDINEVNSIDTRTKLVDRIKKSKN